MSDDWDVDDGMAPEGAPEELLHLAMTGNGAWGLSIKDALQMREHMAGGKPPQGDSAWAQELEHHLRSQLHPDVHAIARRIAWAAYRQGILHGEELARYR